MNVTVQKVHRTAQFEQFHGLQVAYEESLPADLRHRLPDLAGLEALYAEPNAAFLGFVDDKAAGCVAVTTLDASSDVLKRLYVDPRFRNAGLARALVGAALQFSREHERLRVVLDTDRERLNGAYRLYVSLGFEECAPYGPVDYAHPTFMELRIG
ncbi:MAG: ysnE [Candidatus Eremiobacteraeota bacterium]|nr:ysnE [Candidatus Eremiobacteraeota bacterium]